MAEDIILPIEDEPGSEVEQFLTQSTASEPILPPLPALVMGPKFIEVLEKPTALPYTGMAITQKLPEFENLSRVLTDTIQVLLKNIRIRVFEDVNYGTVSHSGDDIVLTLKDSSFIPLAGGMKGVAAGDDLTARQHVVSDDTGEVTLVNKSKLVDSASATKFVNVLPGDILVTRTQTQYGDVNWKTSVNPAIQEFSITEVGSGGSYIIVDGNLQLGSNLEYVVVRESITTILSDGVVDTAATKAQLRGYIGAGDVEFKLTRSLVPSEMPTIDNPMTSDLEIPSFMYSLQTLVDPNDAIKLNANIGISGLTGMIKTVGTGSLTVLTNPKLLTVAGDLTSLLEPVEVGDIIYFTNDAGNAVSATVQNISFSGGSTSITLLETQTSDVTSAAIRTGYKTSITGATRPVIDSQPVISYRARSIKDVGKIMTIQRSDDLDELGPNKPFNTIRVAARACKANAGDNAIYALVTEDESVDAFLEAYERAEAKHLYNIVPLSELISVHTLGKVHVDSLSTPRKAMWRMLWAFIKKPTEKAIVPLKNSGQLFVNTVLAGVDPNYSFDAGTSVTLTDPAGDFYNVFDGYIVKAYFQSGVANTIPQTGITLVNSNAQVDSNNVTKYMRIYKVDAKLNNKKLRLLPIPMSGENGLYSDKSISNIVEETNATYTVKYEIIKVLDKDEIVQAYAKTARSFSDRRVNLITNPACRMLFPNALGAQIPERVPGFILGAAVAGLSSNTLPHQPLTRLILADIYSVEDGRDTYTSDQLSILLTGGCWIFVQDGDNTGVYTLKQRTSSGAGIKEREYSVTKNVDEVSYAISFGLRSVVGVNNNNPKSRAKADGVINVVLDSRTKDVKGVNDSELGPQLINPTRSGFAADPIAADTAFDRITAEVPIPLNKLKVGLYV